MADGGRLGHVRVRSQGHSDQRSAAEQHVDANDQPQSPGRGAGAGQKDHGRRNRSTIPLESIQPHLPESRRRWSSANMMVAIPSMRKKAINR